MLLGAHVSIAGGLEKSIERGSSIGASCIQTFASPPRTLSFFPFSNETITTYKTAKLASSISLHVFHAVYLVNLASERPAYVKASVDSLIQYQQAAAAIDALGTIFHIGSHKGLGFDTVKHQIADAIIDIMKSSPANTTLMIENAAGHNGTVGQTLDELVQIFDTVAAANISMQQLGLCLDTQHAFASGIDGRDASALDQFIEQVDQKIGIDRVKVIHCNDSKIILNGHKDRHENIGLGELGSIGLRNWLHHPKICHLPFILEVPGLEGSGPGKADLEALQAIAVS